jgi:omega-6 fatty acid desaturase (delta-12 desaturase)
MIDAPEIATAAAAAPANSSPSPADWKKIVLKYQEPSLGRALGQMANTFIPLVLLWVAMYFTLPNWWLTMPLALLAGVFMIRVFIIFHDCGHGSFFKSNLANDVVGFISGMLTLTPYFQWRWEHSIHHATAGHLDKRGTGDVYTMTVREYQAASLWDRLVYRLSRNPIVLFVLAPLALFAVRQRFVTPNASSRERNSVHLLNLALLITGTCLSLIFGVKNYLIIQLTAMMVAGSGGIWMFYVQHQFEGTYWAAGKEWDYTLAALQGSSFYKLPKILQWFSGNIGFHHIHHLSPRIPNYNLEECHNANPIFNEVKPITLLTSLKSFSLRLWDEDSKKLVGYGHLRTLRPSR